MKKVLAVMLTLVLAFTFCIPSFADPMQDIQDAVSSVLEQFDISQIDPDAIREAIEGALSGIIGGGEPTTGNSEGTLPDISNMDITPQIAKMVVQLMQNEGFSKEDIGAAFDQMKADGQINEESYNNLMEALEAAPETPTETPSVPENEVPEAAQGIIDALHQAGVTDEQMKSTVDDLYQRGVIPQNVYEEIIRILDAQESTTASDNSGGGIRDFLGGIVSGIGDFFGNLFGNGGDDSGDDATTSPSDSGAGNNNPTDFGANDATGDTVVTSVAAVAAVAAIAGVALVLTKKKEDR